MVLSPLLHSPARPSAVRGGGVICTHTSRPTFAIAKIDFPESFDLQPEFGLGRGDSIPSSGSSPYRGRVISRTSRVNMAHKPHPPTPLVIPART